MIFVFGSNQAGAHGAGAAREARENFGAEWGVGEGPSGRSYALPTKNKMIETLPLEAIERHVKKFLAYAESHPQSEFFVTAIGCGLAGYSPEQIAPMFAKAPQNCSLHRRLAEVLK